MEERVQSDSSLLRFLTLVFLILKGEGGDGAEDVDDVATGWT